MPDDYLKHKVFDDLKYMREFYDSLSYSCYYFVASGTKGIGNYASYVYSAIEGTVDSITTLLTKGRINDAYTLIRKLFDDILLEIYIDVTLKDKFCLENYIVEEVNEWIQGKHRIPKSDKILKCIETSERTRDLYPFFGWDTYLGKNRELLDDSVHSNRKHPIKDVYLCCWGIATFASNTKSHDDKGRGRQSDCLLRREQDQLQTVPVGTWD